MRDYWDVTVPRSVERAMLKHAISHDTVEICGLMAGTFIDETKDILVGYFEPIENIAPDPIALFRMDPLQQIMFMKKANERGLQTVGCFHSHPHNFGIPSSIDAGAINEDYCWLIWGGQDNQIRAWYPRDFKDPSAGFEAAHLNYTKG